MRRIAMRKKWTKKLKAKMMTTIMVSERMKKQEETVTIMKMMTMKVEEETEEEGQGEEKGEEKVEDQRAEGNGEHSKRDNHKVRIENNWERQKSNQTNTRAGDEE